MKRYKNVSGSPLPIDCIGYTKYMTVGEIASLPQSRDVRHYSMTRKLVVVNERRNIGVKPPEKKKPSVFKKPTKVVEKEAKVLNIKKDGDK